MHLKNIEPSTGCLSVETDSQRSGFSEIKLVKSVEEIGENLQRLGAYFIPGQAGLF